MSETSKTIISAKGRPMLFREGKTANINLQYYPAQETEIYGDTSSKEWNSIFRGDNYQVLSHLMKEYRGKIKLIYIDPPFDSKADYVKKIKLKGQDIGGREQNLFEEQQYSDIRGKDEYLQFMYERLLLLRELLADDGSIYLHCDHHKSHLLRCILDEIFGETNFLNEISRRRGVIRGRKVDSFYYPFNKDTIYIYGKDTTQTIRNIKHTKGEEHIQEEMYKEFGYKKDEFGYYIDSARNDYTDDSVIELHKQNRIYVTNGGKLIINQEKGTVSTDKGNIRVKAYRELKNGMIIEIKHPDNIWDNIKAMGNNEDFITDYPTQKPEALLERIIKASSNPGDIVLDCFMGSGTTCAVAQKLGRRWIGCDINTGAIQTTTKRITKILQEQKKAQKGEQKLIENENIEPEKTLHFLPSFKVYNVNEYNLFKNKEEGISAYKEILMELYGVKSVKGYFDGKSSGSYVKIIDPNRILSKKDIEDVLTHLEQSGEQYILSNSPLSYYSIELIASGKELDAYAYLETRNKTPYTIKIRDMLIEKEGLVFKEPIEIIYTASTEGLDASLRISDFVSPVLLKKLAIENKGKVEDNKVIIENWKTVVDSIAIDIDYTGDLFNAEIIDLTDKKTMVEGIYKRSYPVAGEYTVAIKAIDILGEEKFETFTLAVV